MNKKVPVAITLVAAQLAAYHLSQPSDCNCAEQQVGAVPMGLPQQPENLPEIPPLLLERDSAGSSSTVISAIGTDGLKAADFSSWNTLSVA
jgi:hypothetical protein